MPNAKRRLEKLLDDLGLDDESDDETVCYFGSDYLCSLEDCPSNVCVTVFQGLYCACNILCEINVVFSFLHLFRSN